MYKFLHVGVAVCHFAQAWANHFCFRRQNSGRIDLGLEHLGGSSFVRPLSFFLEGKSGWMGPSWRVFHACALEKQNLLLFNNAGKFGRRHECPKQTVLDHMRQHSGASATTVAGVREKEEPLGFPWEQTYRCDSRARCST